MTPLRGVLISCSFLAVALLAGQAAAGVLPESSYSSDWQGSVFYGLSGTSENEQGLKGQVDFAVYDTEDLQFEGEQGLFSDFDMPDGDQYLYAYQISNDLIGISETEISYFGLLGITEGTDYLTFSSSDSPDDPSDEGIEPASGSQAEWNFHGDSGLVEAGDHSWFLFVTSSSAPIIGDYEVRGPADDLPVPGHAPEPATIVMLGTAGIFLVRKRRQPV